LNRTDPFTSIRIDETRSRSVRARRLQKGMGLTLAALLALIGVRVAAQDDPKAVFASLSDDAKKIVTESNKTLGDDATAPCNAGRTKVASEVRLATARLGESGQLSGVAGFFQIEAENYYGRICGRRMRR
jgi:hypothetical protein